MFASYQRRWWIVAASMFGLMFVIGTVNTFSFAVFLKPVSSDLHVSRSVMASGLLLAMLISGVLTPVMGALNDKWGSRRVLLPGIPLFAFAVASLAWLTKSPAVMYCLFALTGLAGAAQNTVPYAKVVSSWFDRERGLALGFATCGIGFGIVVVPQVAGLLIQAGGWRMAYVELGAIIMLLAFVPVVLFVREPYPGEAQQATGNPRTEAVAGLTATEVFTGAWRFWAMSGGFFLAVISTNGTLAHVVALLTDRGVSVQEATSVLSAAGIGVITGRLLCGWCLDQLDGPRVAVCFFVVPAVGIALLASGGKGAIPFAGAALCGMGLGAHVGLMAFFASRYFGLKAYGKVFGAMFGLFLIGNGVGPYVNGLSFDLLHSYRPALIAFSISLLCASVLFLPLGPYAFAPRAPASPRDREALNSEAEDRRILGLTPP